MVDFTIVNPTKDSFNTGPAIDQPFVLGIQTVGNPSIGNGTLVTYLPNSVAANGSFDVAGDNGTFNLSIEPDAQNPADYILSLIIDGSFSPYSRSFVASGSIPAQGQVLLTDVSDSTTTVLLSQNNGSVFTDGKIDIDPSWAPVTLYIDSNV